MKKFAKKLGIIVKSGVLVFSFCTGISCNATELSETKLVDFKIKNFDKSELVDKFRQAKDDLKKSEIDFNNANDYLEKLWVESYNTKNFCDYTSDDYKIAVNVRDEAYSKYRKALSDYNFFYQDFETNNLLIGLLTKNLEKIEIDVEQAWTDLKNAKNNYINSNNETEYNKYLENYKKIEHDYIEAKNEVNDLKEFWTSAVG